MLELLVDVRREAEERIDVIERLLRMRLEPIGRKEQELLAGVELEPPFELLRVPAPPEIRPAAERPAVVPAVVSRPLDLACEALVLGGDRLGERLERLLVLAS